MILMWPVYVLDMKLPCTLVHIQDMRAFVDMIIINL